MQITTVMVVMFLIWCTLTLLISGPAQIPPAPTAVKSGIRPTRLSDGSKDTVWLQIPVVAIIIAFGHSLLAMSGFETLAQVYREIESPKLKNLKITANIVCVFAVVSHRRDHAVGGHDHSGCDPAAVCRQPARRSGDASCGPAAAAAWLSTSLSSSSAF